ncbi:MAG: DUF481 domain-containing protein [Acidobacteriaceae bacterium]
MKFILTPSKFVPCLLLAVGLLPVLPTQAHAADTGSPDVLVFSNGDTLSGKLDHEADGKVFFKSDNADKVEIPWNKLKSLHTQRPFAVIEKDEAIRRKGANITVPIGSITLSGDTLTVDTAKGARKVPVNRIAYIVDQAEYEKNVMRGQGIFQGIDGTVSAGASTVSSTQNSVSVNTAIVLTRAVPPVEWLPPRRRSLLNFSSNYGRVSQAGTPTAKTNILHGGIEEDEYLTPRFYLLQQAQFDHNFSQGLDLQQLYGLGVGYTALKSPIQELDFTAVISYTRQEFADSPQAPPPVAATTSDLIGSSFGDNYMHKFPKKILLTEVASINLPWNKPSDYFGNVAVNASFPVFKNFGFSVGFVDSYLNNAQTGFKGNSVQFNTGLTYAIHR